MGRDFVCIVISLSFLIPFLLRVAFAGWGQDSEPILHVTENGWALGDTR